MVQQLAKTVLLFRTPHCDLVGVLLAGLARLVPVLPVQVVSLQVPQRRLCSELLQLQQAVVKMLLAARQSLLAAISLLAVLLVLQVRRLSDQLMD